VPDHLKKTMKRVAIGVEVTGSKATVVVVDCHGVIHHRFHAKTLRGRPAIATLGPYLRTIELAFTHAKSKRFHVSGIGISLPGTLDLTTRRPEMIPVLPSLNKFPLCELLEERYKVNTKLHVDVDAALTGEYCFGAGKGFRRLLYLNVNSVVGAAVLIDGKVQASEQAYIGHVCHLPVSMSGSRCSCGRYGCINTLISMEAMHKMVQRALRRGEQSNLLQRLSNREQFSSQLLAEEALRGDPVALHIYCEVGRWIGAATIKYIDIYEPEVLVLGGEALNANELLIANVRNALKTRSTADADSLIEVVPAHLGSDATLLGSVSSFFQG
jgi:glucokinase